MQSLLSREIENRINNARSKIDNDVRQALTEMGGKLRPKAEADANLRKSFEQTFRDRNRAHGLCDDVAKGLTRRHGPNAKLMETQQECLRQFRRHLWLDAEKRQDEMVARLTAGQVNLMGGSHFQTPANQSDPIGWAIANNGPGDVLVDGKGCPVLRFKLPMNYDGSMAPHLQQGQPIIATGKVRRDQGSFNIQAFKEHLKSGVAESNLSHMYLDIEGNVTVGVGHLLRTVEDALDINFIEVGAGTGIVAPTTPADPDNVRTVFQRLKDEVAKGGPIEPDTTTRTLNFEGSFYQQFSRVVVPGKGPVYILLFPSEGFRLLDQDVAEFEKQIKARDAFPNFESYPVEVRFALMDMAFNLGTKRGLERISKIFSKCEDEKLATGSSTFP